MIEPKIATEIPATIMVFMPVPRHTMNKGASADLGRLFKMTRVGSNMAAMDFENHKRDAHTTLKSITKKKLNTVSARVYPICVKSSPVFPMEKTLPTMREGELKKKASIQFKLAAVSHKIRKMAKTRKRKNLILR